MTRVLGALLLLFALSADAQVSAAQAVFGPERLLPEAGPGDALFPSTIGSILPDGEDGYLVFWTPRELTSARTPIMITRTDAAGVPSGEAQLLLDGREAVQSVRALRLPQETGYLLIWSEQQGLFAMVYDRALQTVWNAPARLSALNTGVSATCNAVHCLVAVARSNGIEGVLISPSGQLTGGSFLLTRPAQRLALAPANGGFIAAWVGQYPNEGIYASTFNDDLAPIGEMLFERRAGEIAAGPNGDGATMVWTSGKDVRAARVGLDGRSSAPKVIARVDSTPEFIGLATSDTQHLVLLNYTERPAGVLISAGVTYPKDIYGVRITHALDPLDDAPRPLEIAHWANSGMSAASNGRDYLLGWNYSSAAPVADGHARLKFVDASGAAGETRLLRAGPQPQYGGALAWNGSGHLAVWAEPVPRPQTADEQHRLLASIVGGDGRAAPPALISTLRDAESVSAASDGRDYAVLWSTHMDGSMSSGTRVAILDGHTAAAKRIVELSGIAMTDIVWTGRAYVYIAQLDRTAYLARLAPDGKLLSFSVFLSSSTPVSAIDLAADDGFVAVAWANANGTSLTILDEVRPGGTTTLARISARNGDVAVAVEGTTAFVVTSDTTGVYATQVEGNSVRPESVLDTRGGSSDLVASPFQRGFLAQWRNGGVQYGARYDAVAHPPFRIDTPGRVARSRAPLADGRLSILFSENGRLAIRELVAVEPGTPRRRATDK